MIPLLGSRLREERDRLQLSQQELADACGVTMRSQRNYEKDERLPDAAYLAALTQVGVDALYVLAGDRSFEPGPSLTAEEQVMLDHYRAASREVRKAALGALIGAGPAKTPGRQVFHGKVGQSIAGNVDQRGAKVGVFGKKK